jgi:hypothetical protein
MQIDKQFRHHPLRYLVQNLFIVIGLVLVWRGVWYILDGLDLYLWGDPSHMGSALLGIIVGLLVLFIPDHDLKEIQRL